MKATAKFIWQAYRAAGMTEAGAAAMLGAGIEPESAFRPNNVEDRMHSELGWTDEQYISAVDNGSYKKFTTDAYGVGIHQWTLGYRKNKMLNRAKALGKSIGDLEFQTGFAIYELTGEGEYAALWNALRTSSDVDKLSDMVVDIFERPANATQQKLARRPLSRKWLKEFSGTAVEEKPKSKYWPPRTLDLGMSGPDVLIWHGLMRARGIACPEGDRFTQDSRAATITFQESAGLVPDGIPGPLSWAAGIKY